MFILRHCQFYSYVQSLICSVKDILASTTPHSLSPQCLLTFMLLVGWIMYSDRDQDEEDEKRPDDLNQQLDLRKQDQRDDNRC